jgi:hypothetical protein
MLGSTFASPRRLAILFSAYAVACGSPRSAPAPGEVLTDGSTGGGGEGGATEGGDDAHVLMDAEGECAALSWHALAVPAEAAADSFASVAGTGPTDVWACSTNGQDATALHLLHGDGTALTEAALPVACASLWASAPGDVWAGGSPHYVDHLVGGQWLSVNLLDQRSASAIWGNRPDNVWFAGVNYSGGHWDGTALSTGPFDLQGTRLWGTGDDALWIMAPVPTTAVATGVFPVNEAATADAAYDPFASVTGPPGDASAGVTAALWAADDTHVWVVGSAGFIGFFDGHAWAPAASGTTNDLTAIWGSSPGDVWAVGNAGTILHWNGSAWSSVPSPTSADLHAVFGADACDLWAVGDRGAVLALGR